MISLTIFKPKKLQQPLFPEVFPSIFFESILTRQISKHEH